MQMSAFEEWLEVDNIRKKSLGGDVSEDDRSQIKQDLVEKYSVLIKILNSLFQKRIENNHLSYVSITFFNPTRCLETIYFH